jgi:hypothetical protein
LGLRDVFYDRLLDFFHSKAIKVDAVATLLCRLLIAHLPASVVPKVNGRLIFIGDGIKKAKTGRKMPAVKLLHQESANNTKPEYIYGHSCQAVSLLVGCAKSFFALPITCRIHEGVVISNRATKSLLDKMVDLIVSLAIKQPYYFVLDAYYASSIMANGLIGDGGHLISRVRSNAVAYYCAEPTTKKRGRKKIYGEKIKLKALFKKTDQFVQAPSPVYGENDVDIK